MSVRKCVPIGYVCRGTVKSVVVVVGGIEGEEWAWQQKSCILLCHHPHHKVFFSIVRLGCAAALAAARPGLSSPGFVRVDGALFLC